LARESLHKALQTLDAPREQTMPHEADLPTTLNLSVNNTIIYFS
jgi:hypothetical protein